MGEIPSGRTCDSCGRTDEDTEPVHRVRVVTDPNGEPSGRAELDVEHWCASCAESYPNLPASAD